VALVKWQKQFIIYAKSFLNVCQVTGKMAETIEMYANLFVKRLKYCRSLILPMQSVPITTKVVSLNPDYGEVYSIQQYVIKFVSDLRQVGGFLRVLRFPPLIKLTTTI